MAELDYWHPVLRSEELRRTPVGVVLAGVEVVVFRASNGTLGALEDVCPHRRMRLSLGRVAGERLVCPYHGWSWAVDGSGASPGNARVVRRARAFDAVERHGAVWIKERGTAVAFPAFDVVGHHPVGLLRRTVAAPLELVLDNFTEVEHTGCVHLLLGYPTERMGEVESEVTLGPESIRVYNEGPQRALPWAARKLLGIASGDHFVDDWTTFFTPVHTVYEHYWVDPVSGARRGDALRIAVFFTPRSERETELFVLAYSTRAPWAWLGLGLLFNRLVAWLVDVELGRDVRTLERLADRRPEIAGNALGRFDKALVASRERIERLYRGRAARD